MNGDESLLMRQRDFSIFAGLLGRFENGARSPLQKKPPFHSEGRFSICYLFPTNDRGRDRPWVLFPLGRWLGLRLKFVCLTGLGWVDVLKLTSKPSILRRSRG